MADENESDDQMAAALVRRLKLGEEAQASFKAMFKTMREIPKIESEHQYVEYKRILDEMWAAAGLPDRSGPEFDSAFARLANSNEGAVAIAYGSRIEEWQQKKRASEAADIKLS